MSEIKVVYEDDEWVEYEFTQPNDLIGDTFFWNNEDWKKWNDKMERLEKEGTKGQLETIRVKLKKNPFIDGSKFLGGSESTGDGSESAGDDSEIEDIEPID